MQTTEGFIKEELTIDLYMANAVGILILFIAALIFGLPFYLIWENEVSLQSFSFIIKTPWVVFIATLLGIAVHELIHGIMWMMMTRKGFNSIKFGIMRMLTPYCHCKEPLTVRQYIWGAIMPAIVLGFIPAILAIVVGSAGWLLFGIVFTMAATGDFMIVYSLRNEAWNTVVEDHPSEGGCYVYRPVGVSDQN